MRGIGFAWLISLAALNCRPTESLPPATVVESRTHDIREVFVPPLVPGGIPAEADWFLVTSDVYAGCLVGLQALQSHWREQGVELTPHELTIRHGEIGCRRVESGMIMVTFFPPTLQLGGDITYYVDPVQLTLVKTVFGR